MKTANLLTAARSSLGISRSEVAMKLGFNSTQYVYMVETGHKLPSERILKEWASIYGLSTDQLQSAIDDDRKNKHEFAKAL